MSRKNQNLVTSQPSPVGNVHWKSCDETKTHIVQSIPRNQSHMQMTRNQSSFMNPITRSSWLLAASAFALSVMASDPCVKVARAVDDVQGNWVGWLETPKQHLRLLVRIDSVSSEKVNGNSILQGSITSPDQSADSLPLRDAMLSDAADERCNNSQSCNAGSPTQRTRDASLQLYLVCPVARTRCLILRPSVGN